jgi:hypothetical protein
MWVRSYRAADAFGWSWQTGAIAAGSANGRLRLSSLRLRDGSYYTPPWFTHSHYPATSDPPSNRMPTTWRNLGFGFERNGPPNTWSEWVLLIPFWAILIATAAPPLLYLRWRRRQPEGEIRCPVCNYDLRATPDRCPECGTKVNA